MKRNTVGFLLSLLALSVAVIVFRDSYLFSKVSIRPPWAEFLPGWLGVSDFIGLLCLAPAALLPERLKSAAAALATCVLLAPVPVLIAYSNYHAHAIVWMSLLFDYCWVGLHCLIPAVMLFIVRGIVDGSRALAKRASSR
ncbi:putative membrane protein [Lysobacter antibioticus]|nr:hypothetical protein [Lysobacter antibioticus]ALN64899.1 putative membrane protein [Lysobacter antibioticus]